MYWFEYDEDLARKAIADEAWQIGIERGIEQGIEKGREKEKFEMVKNLLLAKTPLKYIVAATGWTEEKILKLADS